MSSQKIRVVCMLNMILSSVSLGAVIYVDIRLTDDCTFGEYSVANRDNSGSDGNAYNTAQEAADVSAPGDTIYFRGGTYYERTSTASAVPVLRVLTSGTLESPITYKSYNGEEVILSADNLSYSNKRNAIALGLKPSSSQEISGQGVQDIVIEGLIVEDATYEGLGIFGPANKYASAENPTENIVIRNVIARNNSGGNGVGKGINSTGKLVNVLIEHCEAYSNTGTGISLGRLAKDWHDAEPEEDMSAAQYCTIRNCLVYGNNNPSHPGNTDGVGGSHMYRCALEGNVVFENSDDGIDSYASIEMTIKSNISFRHAYEGGNGCGFKFSAGGGGRHTVAENISVNNAGYSFEGSAPSNRLRTYYPSRLYNNLALNCSSGFSFGYGYTAYAGFSKVWVRNNVCVGNSGNDFYYSDIAWLDSDHNFIGNAVNLSNLRAGSQDVSSVTGDPQLADSATTISTDFDPIWSIEEKLEHVRSQVREAFSPLQGSILVDTGTPVSGYHNPSAGDDVGDDVAWYGSAPDIGVREIALRDVDDLTPSGSSQNSVTFTWTVPGVESTDRKPTQYDIRYASSLIEDATWDTATPIQGEPVPGDFGQEQSHTITGLASGSTFYIAIKTSDELENTSWLSNVVSTTTATAGNHAPVLDPIGEQSTYEGQELTFVIGASDDDGDPLIYSVATPPTGASFVPATRTFTWVPTGDQSGTYHVTFQVTDGAVLVSEAVTIAVHDGSNHPPVLNAIGGKSVDENDILTFSVGATDVDGQSIAYSATSLPSGASFANQTFQWTPGYTQAGSYDVTFVASDGLAQDSETITISVDNVNRPPVLGSVSDRSVNENVLLSFSVTGDDPDGDAMSYSATGLPSGANFVGGAFSWIPTFNQAGSYSVTFTVGDGGLTDSAPVTIVVANVNDTTAPSGEAFYPLAEAIQVPLNALIGVTVSDAGWGIDANTVVLRIDNQVVYSGNAATYDSAHGTCRRTGTEASYSFSYQPDDKRDFDQQVSVSVSASDQANNVMTPYTYSFTTEMRAFGFNKSVSWGPSDVDKGAPVTVCDSTGTIWAVYHAGPTGQRDVYISKMLAGETNFTGPVRLTTDPSDQCHPCLAIDGDDKLHVVWQDDRRGNWDIYARTSTDGAAWSPVTRVTESDDDQTRPVVAIDTQSPCTAYLVWQDGGAGHQDIYVASSSDGLLMSSTVRVTSNSADQTDPDIAIDDSGAVYLVWADARNGSTDVYGAASETGPWSNVAVATGAGSQDSPCVATEATGTVLHFLWCDDASGDSDIRHASSNGMPSSTLTGVSIIDDTSGADQTAPTLAVCGTTGADLEVCACWRDERNVTAGGGDTDLYFADVDTGGETNVLVGDGGTSSSQSEPAIAVDGTGFPYVVWTDGRNVNEEIYFAGGSHTDVNDVDSDAVIASTGGTVGVISPTAVGDVSVVIPAGAPPHDVTVRITAIENPQFATSQSVLAYEFDPSGLQFSAPVTITIPYAVADFPNGAPAPYWYDSQTDSLIQQGITGIESIVISETVHAVRFKTTHFTPYGLFETLSGGGSSGGGGGGGCSLSRTGDEDIVGFLLPYLVMAMAITALKLRDRKMRRGADR